MACVAEPGSNGIVMAASDPELLRWRCMLILNNIAVFSTAAHGRLISAGVPALCVRVLAATEALGRDRTELHDYLTNTSVSCLCCLTYHPPSRPSLLAAAAPPLLQRIAEGPPSNCDAVSAIALANLVGGEATLSARVVKKVVLVFKAALAGEVFEGIYFVPWQVAMSVGSMAARWPNAKMLVEEVETLSIILADMLPSSRSALTSGSHRVHCRHSSPGCTAGATLPSASSTSRPTRRLPAASKPSTGSLATAASRPRWSWRRPTAEAHPVWRPRRPASAWRRWQRQGSGLPSLRPCSGVGIPAAELAAAMGRCRTTTVQCLAADWC